MLKLKLSLGLHFTILEKTIQTYSLCLTLKSFDYILLLLCSLNLYYNNIFPKLQDDQKPIVEVTRRLGMKISKRTLLLFSNILKKSLNKENLSKVYKGEVGLSNITGLFISGSGNGATIQARAKSRQQSSTQSQCEHNLHLYFLQEFLHCTCMSPKFSPFCIRISPTKVHNFNFTCYLEYIYMHFSST